MVVVDHLPELLLEREWLQLFPREVLGFEDEYAVLQFEHFFRLGRDELLGLFQQTAQDDDVVGVETKTEVVRHSLWKLHIHYSPNLQLRIIPLNLVQEFVLSGEPAKHIDVAITALARRRINPGFVELLGFIAQLPFARPE